MIFSFSKLGAYGRTGNQFFQVAGTLGLAEKYGAQACFTKWAYEDYFVNPLPHGPMQTNVVKEKHFDHYDWELTEDCDLLGYMQSEQYFPKENPFVFKPDFLQTTKMKVPAGLWEKETILIHIRRGDYQEPKYYEHYWQAPVTYFIDALLTHFPQWQEQNLIFISDDIAYCRVHFETLSNAYFVEDLTDIETIALATFCDNFILSNSSFGWWAAWLGEKPHSKIVHPGHMFRGTLAEQKNTKDYWPERWTRHQKDSYKLDLTDTSFTIPVFYDSPDRKKNLDLCVCMLQTNFETNIIIGEQGGNKFEYMQAWCKYMNFDLKYFHRTKMLNDMAMAADTPYIANWDADVIIAPCQIYLTVLRLRGGEDMVFPYDGRFARLPREQWFKPIEKLMDIGAIGDTEPKGKRGKPVPESSVGGAVFFNKESFVDGGMENEYMISFGPEDCERNDRFTKLGFKVAPQSERVRGCLYHIDHWCGPDSNTRNPFFRANHGELDKIRAMSREELRQYIDSWPWRHMYTASYYRRISEGAVRSAKEVYNELQKTWKYIGAWNIIDIGCGVGEWNNNFILYQGVDFNIPSRSLMIKPEQYINCDLEKEVVTSKFNLSISKFELCLCLETAEHVSEGRADILVKMLCDLSDRVLFSAAIEFQGGTGHINEQPAHYWAAKFKANGFYPYKTDIRKALFHNPNVEMWYKNNMILYTREKFEIDYELDFVHPDMFVSCVTNLKNQLEVVNGNSL